MLQLTLATLFVSSLEQVVQFFGSGGMYCQSEGVKEKPLDAGTHI